MTQSSLPTCLREILKLLVLSKWAQHRVDYTIGVNASSKSIDIEVCITYGRNNWTLQYHLSIDENGSVVVSIPRITRCRFVNLQQTDACQDTTVATQATPRASKRLISLKITSPGFLGFPRMWLTSVPGYVTFSWSISSYISLSNFTKSPRLISQIT